MCPLRQPSFDSIAFTILLFSLAAISDGNVTMNAVLLTVSGVIPNDINDQIARGERPEADYIAMARVFGADLVDYSLARQRNGRFGKLLEKIGGANLLLAWDCFQQKKHYRVIFTDGEQVGLPLAMFLKFARKRPSHLMITHILSVKKKIRLIDSFHLTKQIDQFFVYASRQKQFIQNHWHIPSEKVIFTPFMVDANFFHPQKGGPGNELLQTLAQDPRPIICAVGLELRDYPTLLKAVAGLDVQIVIAAASPWSKRADSTAGQAIPPNVTVSRFTQYELRDLYALSRFMVMPLYETPFQAGVTAILEAMAMQKAVICSKTSGQTDILIDQETGLYVPPGDANALRLAIKAFLNDPIAVERMGKNGRYLIDQQMKLDRYADRLNQHIHLALQTSNQYLSTKGNLETDR